MPKSNLKARKVRQKTREVVEFHRDVERPGKPLHLIIPFGLLALAALAAIAGVAHQTWVTHAWEESKGIGTLVVLLPVYIGSVFAFSYGYELYDVDRATKLTAWIVLLTVGIVVVVGVLFCLLGGSGDSKNDKGSSRKSSSEGSSSNSSNTSTGNWFSSGGSSSSSNGTPWIDLNLSSSPTSDTGPETSIAPPPPQPIACTFCKSEFIPEESEFKCPNCGASSSRTESAPNSGSV